MNKKLFILLYCISFSLFLTAKTRYVASHYESIRVEVFDSLGNKVDSLSSFNETRYSILCKTVGGLQFSIFSLNVSEEESKGIKRAKNAQGWAMAAAISSAVSYGINRGMAASTRGLRSLNYSIRAVGSAIDMNYSIYGLERASAALNRLKNFEGIAFVIHNPTPLFKSIIVDNVNISIMPKGDYPILIHKNKPIIIGIALSNKQFAKIRITADRLVYKTKYDFEYEGYYYATKHNSSYRGSKRVAINIDNPNDETEISEEDFQAIRKLSKQHVKPSTSNSTLMEDLGAKVYVYSRIMHIDPHCHTFKHPEKIKEFVINNEQDFNELQEKYWTCGKCLAEKLTFEQFVNITNGKETSSQKATKN